MASSSPESAGKAEVAYRYELYWRAVIEKDLDAQQELAELRQREDEAIADLDQQRYEAQQAYDAARASDALEAPLRCALHGSSPRRPRAAPELQCKNARITPICIFNPGSRSSSSDEPSWRS